MSLLIFGPANCSRQMKSLVRKMKSQRIPKVKQLKKLWITLGLRFRVRKKTIVAFWMLLDFKLFKNVMKMFTKAQEAN
jgi:hypothetical protein